MTDKSIENVFLKPQGVKECIRKPIERTFLKKLIFIEKALTYASLRDLLEKQHNTKTTRQYLYGIVSGRLTPSFEFATVLCKSLGIKNVFTVFEQNEIHFPDFQSVGEVEGK